MFCSEALKRNVPSGGRNKINPTRAARRIPGRASPEAPDTPLPTRHAPGLTTEANARRERHSRGEGLTVRGLDFLPPARNTDVFRVKDQPRKGTTDALVESSWFSAGGGRRGRPPGAAAVADGGSGRGAPTHQSRLPTVQGQDRPPLPGHPEKPLSESGS